VELTYVVLGCIFARRQAAERTRAPQRGGSGVSAKLDLPADRQTSPSSVVEFSQPHPDWCGWTAPPGEGNTIIGNYYATRFKDAWEVAQYTAANLDKLESRTRAFSKAFGQARFLR